MSMVQPALMASQPAAITISVAPVLARCSPRCLRAVVAFADAAWPSPDFDPVRAIAAATTADAVAEHLARGRQRPAELDAAGQLSIQVGPCSSCTSTV